MPRPILCGLQLQRFHFRLKLRNPSFARHVGFVGSQPIFLRGLRLRLRLWLRLRLRLRLLLNGRW